MKALVMYESMFGNSERVARSVADGLTDLVEVEIRDVALSTAGDLGEDVDLLVAGGPTHALSLSRPSTREDAIRQGAGQGTTTRGLREWLDALPADLHGLSFATFDTRVSRVRRLPGSAARSAARILRRHGGRMVFVPQSFFVDDVSGPLAADQPDLARLWGHQLAAELLAARRHVGAS